MRLRRCLLAIAGAVLSFGLVVAQQSPVGAAGTRYIDLVFASVSTTSNVLYNTQPALIGGAPESLRLDVHQPSGDTLTSRPALVVIHGGGFKGGSKAQVGDVAIEWARRGYVVFNISYRLDAGNRCQDVQDGRLAPAEQAVESVRCFRAIEAAKQDALAAVRWVRAQAGTYGIDPTRIGFIGASAGAITAIHAAADGDASSRVGAVLSMSGCNYFPETITADDPPVANIHADRDTAVPIECSVNNAALARSKGLVFETKVWYGESTHASELYRKYQREIDPEWTAFMRYHLNLGGFVPANSKSVITGRPNRSAIVSLVATDAAGEGYLQATACDAPAGSTSNLNVDSAAQTRAGLAIVRFDSAGKACVFNSMATHLVVDLQGYLDDRAFDDPTDVRLVDTRSAARPDARSMTVLRGTPNRSAVISIVATQPAAEGWMQALPCNVTAGGTSNLNVDAADQTRAALAIVAFDATGTACVYTSVASHLVVDLQGYLSATAFEDVADERLVDTRSGRRAPAGGKTVFRGRANSSAFVSVTATDGLAAGWVQVLPCGATPGTTSNINADSAGLTIAGAAVVRFSSSGEACVYTSMETHVIVDLLGYLATTALDDIDDVRLFDSRQ
jgi:dienelactone hydrolase